MCDCAERRSGRLAEKKAFTSGFDIPSAPSTEWLGLPKDYLSDKGNAMEICKDPNLSTKLDDILHQLTPEASSNQEDSFERFPIMHPLLEMLIEGRSNFSEHCLSIGPDDEVAAEILKLQEMLLRQMVVNRTASRRLLKAALRSIKLEKKQAARKERLEREIRTCQRVIEAHEKKKKEKEQDKEEMKSDGHTKDENLEAKGDVRMMSCGMQLSQSSTTALSQSVQLKKEEVTDTR